MLALSEVLIAEHGIASFAELLEVIRQRGAAGEMFLQMDVRPPFADTPADWEDRLEAAFTAVRSSR